VGQRGAEIVRRYLELSTGGDHDGASKLESPDIRFWVSGRLVVSGALTAEQHRKASAGVHDTFPAGYQLHIRSITCEGGRVAVEAQGEGVLADGTTYAPAYAMFFDLADGLITSMREYIDTEYVGSTFHLPARKG
jgi:ketosteroid isomerase-like protein